jgi:hypothetical protein
MDIDTNIDNYVLDDMISLFKISINVSEENINKVNQTMDKINELYNSNEIEFKIHSLFKKISTILTCLHKYKHYIVTKNSDYVFDLDDYDRVVSFVKNVRDYENTDDLNTLVKLLIDQNVIKSSISLSNKFETNAGYDIEYIDRSLSITDKKKHKIVNTFENSIVPGELNSIKRITNLINVHINSCFRGNYYNTNPCNFIYTLPQPFKNVVSMKLASIEIPNSWFLLSSLKKNNIFEIKTTICGNCKIYTIVIPEGNYTNDSIVSFLNFNFFYQSTTDTPLKHIKFSILEHSNRSQFEIVENTPDNFNFSLIFTNGMENILETFGWIIGFRVASYINIEDYILSEGLFDAGGDRYIYLCVNDYQYNYNETNVICFDKSSIEEYTLAKIPLINGKLSLIIDENNKNPLVKIRQYNGPVNLSKLEIKILDKFGNIINLNFMDFSFSLELEVLYERNNVI